MAFVGQTMMIAKHTPQNQMKHPGFTEFYRYPTTKWHRQILPPAKKVPLLVKTKGNSAN